MNWRNALRDIELTKEEMKGRVCSCPEAGNPDEFGDGSSLPCMDWSPDVNLPCSKCIYCIPRD